MPSEFVKILNGQPHARSNIFLIFSSREVTFWCLLSCSNLAPLFFFQPFADNVGENWTSLGTSSKIKRYLVLPKKWIQVPLRHMTRLVTNLRVYYIYIFKKLINNSKAHVRKYINEGNDVQNAQDFQKSMLSGNGVKGLRVALIDATARNALSRK